MNSCKQITIENLVQQCNCCVWEVHITYPCDSALGRSSARLYPPNGTQVITLNSPVSVHPQGNGLVAISDNKDTVYLDFMDGSTITVNGNALEEGAEIAFLADYFCCNCAPEGNERELCGTITFGECSTDPK